MVLLLDDNHKKDLELLKDIDERVLKEFCRIALDYLKQGSNTKIYQSAAQRLNLEPEEVESAVVGIMHLFVEASKIMIPETEFRDSFIVLGFNESCQEELVRCYLENKDEIRSLLTTQTVRIPGYQNLEWRIDAQIASRSLRRPQEPKFVLKLQLERNSGEENILLESDPSNIIHFAEEMEQALAEARSHHSRRIKRNVK